MLINITLKTSNLVNDISGVYLMETGSTSPTPPRGTMLESLAEARTGMLGRLKEFLYYTSVIPVNGDAPKDRPDYGMQSSGTDNIPAGDDILVVLNVSSRRIVNTDAVAKLLHSYLVNAALCRIYTNMAQTELAKVHSEKLSTDIDTLNSMMYKKVMPVYDEE